jgi:hypothetical protein
MRRKGELSLAAIDRGWPHQVAPFLQALADRVEKEGRNHVARVLGLDPSNLTKISLRVEGE